jgi:hypothetical protein
MPLHCSRQHAARKYMSNDGANDGHGVLVQDGSSVVPQHNKVSTLMTCG